MAPPSKLTIQTQAVQRLLKEESSYHKEQEAQVGRIQKLEGGEEGGENRDFMLKQEVSVGFCISPPLGSPAAWVV